MKFAMVKILVFFGAVCAADAVLSATPVNWDYANTGSTIETAADYFEGENWQGGTPAQGLGFSANFDPVSGVRFVKASAALTINDIIGSANGDGRYYSMTAGNQLNLVVDGPLTLGSGAVLRYLSLYGNISTMASDATFYSAAICGDIPTALPTMVANVGTVIHRLDRYANAAGPVRRNFSSSGEYKFSYGGYDLFAPESSSADIVGHWAQTAGSPYLRRVGAKHAIPAGTLVHGAGIADGTFVKRIFSDDSIELSQAIEAGGSSGDNAVTFDALTPDVYLHVDSVARNMEDWYHGSLRLMKCREEDKLTVEIDTLKFHDDREFPFDVLSGYLPGRVIVHNAPGNPKRFSVGTYHFEFAARTDDGVTPGFPDATMEMTTAAAHQLRLTAGEGIAAEIGDVTYLKGTVVKDGRGSVAFPLTGARANYSGTLVVKEGAVELAEGSYVGTVAISNGATLRINGEFKPGSFIVEPGAVIAGNGVIPVSDLSEIPAGVRFAENAAIRLVGGSGEVLRDLPAAAVPGDPALHFDMSQEGALVFDMGTENVRKIFDVRDVGKPEASHMYAETAGTTLAPALCRDLQGNPHHINIPRNNNAASLADTATPVWNRRLTNIRDVFVVLLACYETSDNGGQLLGDTQTTGGDYLRIPDNTLHGSILYHTTDRPAEQLGSLRINGEKKPITAGYPYFGDRVQNFSDYAPFVVEHIPAETGTSADSFAYDPGQAMRNGRQRLCEVLVYTNVLTETERMALTRHLMLKWLNCEPVCARGGEKASLQVLSTDQAVSMAAGENLYAKSVSGGAGSFGKFGAGTLYVDDFVNPHGSLRVAEGEMVIRSFRPERDDVPNGAYLHLDASDESTITCDANGRLASWKDCRADVTRMATPLSASTNPPSLKKVAELCNRTVVDMGPFLSMASTTEEVERRAEECALKFPGTTTGHTVIGVYGTAQGGNAIIGDSGRGGMKSGYGLMRAGDCGANPTDKLLSSYLNPFDPDTRFDGSRNATRTILNDVVVNPRATGFTGGYDILSFVSYMNFGASGFATMHYQCWTGGQELGEILFYPRGLSSQESDLVTAYLKRKWKGVETVGFRAASVDTLTVDAGATLAVDGPTPMQVRKISGSGTIRGSLSLAANAEFEFLIKDDGTIDSLSIADAVDFSTGGTIRLVGDIRLLQRKTHTLVASSAIAAGDMRGWSVAYEGKSRSTFALRAVDGALVLDVGAPGMMMIVR